MNHILKIWPQYYQAVASGKKTFEIRNNDRGFQAGDTVALQQYDPEATDYEGSVGDYVTSDTLRFRIGYVLPIDAERVVFSLLKQEREVE